MKKHTIKDIKKALDQLIEMTKNMEEEFSDVGIQISATIGDGMIRKAYCNNAKSSMILEHIVKRDLEELQERNEEIYS